MGLWPPYRDTQQGPRADGADWHHSWLPCSLLSTAPPPSAGAPWQPGLLLFPGTTRSPWCSCASWSPPWCPGTSGGRACGTPTSWPPSSGTPSHSTSPGWSTASPTCTETGPMTSTSVLGRTRSSPWAPSVSVGWEPLGTVGVWTFLASRGFCGTCQGRQGSGLGLWC